MTSEPPFKYLPQQEIRWQYACVRILDVLKRNPDGMRTSAVKNYVRKEPNLFIDLGNLKGYEFVKAVDHLEAQEFIKASYPGNSTEILQITQKGKDLLDGSKKIVEDAVKATT